MIRILTGDAFAQLSQIPGGRFASCITSPPYWAKLDYGTAGQLGLEPTLEEHLARLSAVFMQVRRVLVRSGTLWINYGDSYNTCNGGPGPSSSRAWTRLRSRMPKLATGFGLKTQTVKRKSLMGLPWRLALRLEADGWYLRAEVIWVKPNPIERTGLDRPRRAHEQIFLFTKSPRSFFRGPCDGVWSIPRDRTSGHPSSFPVELARRCILHGSPVGSEILDPFAGSGTVGLAASQLGRSATLIDISPEFSRAARERIDSFEAGGRFDARALPGRELAPWAYEEPLF